MSKATAKHPSPRQPCDCVKIVLGLALLLYAPFALSAAPVVMLLAHTENSTTVVTPIRAVAELVTSPYASQGLPKWAILPGDTIESLYRPADRAVALFHKVGLQLVPVCRINVRYFRNRQGGWVPNFQLDEEPVVMRKDGHWAPLTTLRGAPSLIVLTSNTLPNAEGFYPALEFGQTIGLTYIDSWIVR
jgi:hypothetical protein